MTPSPHPVNTVMSLRKGATFHSPSSPPAEHHIYIPSLPRRSQTTLEDVVEAHKRRVALTLGDIDRSLSSVGRDSSSPAKQSFRDEALPVPQGILNHAVASRRPEAHNGIMSDILSSEQPTDYNVGGRSLRPRRQIRRPSNYHASDSGLGSSVQSGSLKRSTSTGLTSVSDDHCAKSIVAASAITRSAAAHPSTLENLPRMSIRASNKIHEHILKPLLAKQSLKDFHPIVRDCPRRIHEKEIVCLRDLEKTLVFMAPVSDLHIDDVVGGVAHWFSRCLKERSKTAKLYLDFCLTSIRCIQATVEFLNEREQTRPNDRPYTNGYFVDLVDQIRNYAQQVQASKEKEEKGEALDEMDAESYVNPCKPIDPTEPCDMHETQFQHMTHFPGPAPSINVLKNSDANSFSYRSDEVKLYGGLTRNGRPAELVRVKKNGKAISIATGEPIKMESIEEDEKGGIQMKRSLSEEAANDESILRSMARRKRSASAAELAPKRCREPGCTKEFKRSCDLTKHEKTHSRPWKCTEKSCKYHEYGWPTEKELDRHINDKHSASPVLYKCHYAPCPYKSKRESNCKQHMEKSHGWTYVRSKNNGKNRGSKAGDSSLPTPQTSNHRTPESDSHDEPTPDEDYDGMDYSVHIGFDNNVYGTTDELDFPEYPHEDFMNTTFAPFISPVESRQQQSAHSSEHASPYLVQANSGFQLDNIQANFGPNFGNGNDFQLYEEDIYNAHARVQLPTPSNSIFQRQLDIDTFMASVPVKPEPVPHISPSGHGNTMLYTPTSLGAVDESFEHFDNNDHQLGNDFQLFSNANANMLASNNHHSNNLFGEVPSTVVNFSQSNTQEFFQAFYNANTATSGEWMQHDEGYSGGFGDHHIQ
jgi:hypothetical protein